MDLDGDGKLDVLYTNGDILDEPYLFKPYHGIRWLRNKGGLEFEHRPLTPMYGAATEDREMTAALGVAWYSRIRAIRRLNAAVTAHAEREIAQAHNRRPAKTNL